MAQRRKGRNSDESPSSLLYGLFSSHNHTESCFLRMQSWIAHANIKLPCHLVPLGELIGHCVIMPGLLHRVESFDFWILSLIGCFLFGLHVCLFFKYRLRAWFLFWFYFSSSQLCLSIFEKVIYSRAGLLFVPYVSFSVVLNDSLLTYSLLITLLVSCLFFVLSFTSSLVSLSWLPISV